MTHQGTPFTCFTGTKVQMLAKHDLHEYIKVLTLLALLVQKYKYGHDSTTFDERFKTFVTDVYESDSTKKNLKKKTRSVREFDLTRKKSKKKDFLPGCV
jgi:hypothetical protein